MKLSARGVLFEEGGKDGKLFVINKGELVIQKKEGAQVRNRGVVGPGSVVGERALLDGEPYPFTLRAMESVDASEVSKADLEAAFQKFPVWFSSFIHFMSKRVKILEENKAKIDKIRALPALLFLCAKAAKRTEDGKFDLDPVISSLATINGLGYNETFELLRALCELGIAELIPGERIFIHFYRKNLPKILYRTLFARMSGKAFPHSLLSANDQTILTAFVATAKTSGRDEDGMTFVYAKDFDATYRKLFPGIRLTRRAFENLVQCGYLFPEPALSGKLEFKDIQQFHADREAVKDLLELNRVYPMLDKRLLEEMDRH